MPRITRDELATMHGERTLFAVHHRVDGHTPPVQLVKAKAARARDAKVSGRRTADALLCPLDEIRPHRSPWPLSSTDPSGVEYYADGVEAAARRVALVVEWLQSRFKTLTDKAAAEGIPRDRLLEILGIG